MSCSRVCWYFADEAEPSGTLLGRDAAVAAATAAVYKAYKIFSAVRCEAWCCRWLDMTASGILGNNSNKLISDLFPSFASRPSTVGIVRILHRFDADARFQCTDEMHLPKINFLPLASRNHYTQNCNYICMRLNSHTVLFTGTWLRYVRVFAVAIPPVCRLSSVCNVGAPYSGGWRLEAFVNISSPLCTLASDLRAKFHKNGPRGTPPSEALNARGASK